MPHSILRLDASARRDGSVTRDLTSRILARFPQADVTTRDLRHILGFVGITDVSFVSADRLALDPEATVKSAHDQVAALPLAA
ncbi:hypothetical protein [Alterinioella nitratireducens]|uniref:hypothetical protein n=1 Tax=Alterinioella nitratireducens TaxID=2735915 RepID=UPI00405818DE